MRREEVAREVTTVLADFVDDAEDMPPAEELGLDSFSRLCVLAELEAAFDVVLPDEAIQDVDTAEQLVDLFCAALARPVIVAAPSPEPALAAAGGR